MTVKEQTLEHIKTVGSLLSACVEHIIGRRETHDQSKLESPEAEVFEVYTAKLEGTTYGSDEYKQMLAEMKPALDHHYANNRHHPEYFSPSECLLCFEPQPNDPASHCQKCGNGQFSKPSPSVKGMNLFDILEMLMDWKAATLRHADGDILKSLEINQKRFGYSDEMKQILLNTVRYMGLC